MNQSAIAICLRTDGAINQRLVGVQMLWGISIFWHVQGNTILTSATDRRWSVICTDQTPRFDTHVTVKFNHHYWVKVYIFACFLSCQFTHSNNFKPLLLFFYLCRTHPDGYIHTMFKYPFWQVFCKHIWLCLKWTETAEKETGCVSVLGMCIRSQRDSSL